MASVYIALLHHPVFNKRQEVVTTCITGFDLHDIARSAITFGVKKYFVVNPLPAQRDFAQRMFDHWMNTESLEFNWTRAEAFRLITIKANFAEVVEEITKIEGIKPKVIATSAKPKTTISFQAAREAIKLDGPPVLVMFGTGWGMTDDLLAQAEAVLPPIEGNGEYNHLSVMAATAIILDRLLGSPVT